MLLVPGFMLDDGLWRYVAPGLLPFGPIHHADLTQDATFEDMARRALQTAPPVFVLVGFSMGGYVAREILRQEPDRVAGLILIATSARGDNEVQARRKAALAGQTEASAFRGLSASAISSSLHPDSVDRADLIASIQSMSQRLGGGVFRRQSLLERRDERDELYAIRCPTLVVAGDRDKLRSQAEARELHEGIAGSDFVVIEGTGHMIPLEAPDRLVEVMSRWIAGNRLS